ncbi:MAG: hypothetical protein V3T86_03090 [Planctomycetota bacterium]
MKFVSFLLVASLAPLLFADDDAGQKDETVAAWKGDVRKTVERHGTLIPAKDGADELSIWLEAFRGELLVMQAREHGAMVNKGEVILLLETRDIDEQIDKATEELAAAEMRLRHREVTDAMAVASAAEKLAASERDAERARIRLEGYVRHAKQHRKERTDLQRLVTKYRLEDQEDELTQLRKMYAEDELVDATEDIIIRRGERNFARSKANKDLGDRIHAYSWERNENWYHVDLKKTAADRAAALDRLRRKQKLDSESRASAMESARRAFARQKEGLERLQRDRKKFVQESPRSGLLVHGAADAAPWAGRLELGSTLRPRKVFMTVADPKKLEVKTDVEEKDVLLVKSGLAVEIVPDAADDVTVMGRLKVDYLASKTGKGGSGVHGATVELREFPPKLRAGMRAKLTIVVEATSDAVVIPSSAVIEGDAPRVKVMAADGTVSEVAVVLGTDDGKNVAIKQGLSEGDKVVVAKAKEAEK